MISSSGHYFSSSLDSLEIKDALHHRGFEIRGYSYKSRSEIMENWLKISSTKSPSLLLLIGPILWK
jgi:alpha-L-fucosidase